MNYARRRRRDEPCPSSQIVEIARGRPHDTPNAARRAGGRDASRDRPPIGGGGEKEGTRGAREEIRARSADGGGGGGGGGKRRGARTETRRAQTEGGRAGRGQRRRRRRRKKEETRGAREERRAHGARTEEERRRRKKEARSADRDAQSADRRRTRGARTEEEEEEEEERRTRGARRREKRSPLRGRACSGGPRFRKKGGQETESGGSHPKRKDTPEGQRKEPDGRRAADATWRRRSPIQGRRWRRPSKEQHKAVPRAVPKVHGAEASTERTERNDRSGVGTEMPVRMMRTKLERGRPRGLLPRNDTAPDRCRGWSPTAGWTERRAWRERRKREAGAGGRRG